MLFICTYAVLSLIPFSRSIDFFKTQSRINNLFYWFFIIEFRENTENETIFRSQTGEERLGVGGGMGGSVHEGK